MAMRRALGLLAAVGAVLAAAPLARALLLSLLAPPCFDPQCGLGFIRLKPRLKVDPRPNIVLYLADDLGVGEVNQHDPAWAFSYAPFNNPPPVQLRPPDPQRTMATPNLKRLAMNGMRLLFAHSPTSLCAPSRSAIMLGRQVGSNFIRGNLPGGRLDFEMKEAGWPPLLRKAGYDTAIVGKWGLGSNSGAPWRHGFDLFYGQLSHQQAWAKFPVFLHHFPPGANASLPYSAFQVPVPTNIQASAAGKLSEEFCALQSGSLCAHSDDMFRSVALEFVSNHTDIESRPFFLFWAPTSPHVGTYVAGTEHTSPVRRLGARARQMTQCKRGHAASVEQHLDQDIGAILDLLGTSSRLRNTLFVFASDNGPHAECEDDKRYSPAWFIGSGGLRGIKRDLWQGGLRSPTIVQWPGKIPKGSTSLFPMTLADLGLTFLEAAGVTSFPSSLFRGSMGAPGGSMSVLKSWTSPLLSNSSLHREWLHFELCLDNVANKCKTATMNVSQWRNGPIHKVVVQPGYPPRFFELKADPTETGNYSIPTQEARTLMILNERVRQPICDLHQSRTEHCKTRADSPSPLPSAGSNRSIL